MLLFYIRDAVAEVLNCGFEDRIVNVLLELNNSFFILKVNLGVCNSRNAGDPIDSSAGIVLKKKTGDRVEKGDTLAIFYTDDESKIEEAKREFFEAFTFGNKKPPAQKLIYRIIK